MATTVDFTDLTYCGDEGNKIFAKSVYELPLYDQITLMDGVKSKRKIYSGELGDLWKAYTCQFDPTGEVKLSEDYVEVTPIDSAAEICFDEFWDNYLVESTRISLKGEIPAPFSEWFFDRYRKQLSKEYMEMFWQGDTSYAGVTKTYLKVVDGIEKKLATALTGTSSLISGSAFTVNNILAQVEAAIMASIEVAAANEVDTENFKVMLNHSDARILEVALGKDCSCNNVNQIFNNYSRENGKIYIMGYEVLETLQSRNTIIVGPAKNLVLAFDSFDSKTSYMLKDMRESTLDNSFRVRALTNIGTGILYPELFVMSKP